MNKKQISFANKLIDKIMMIIFLLILVIYPEISNQDLIRCGAGLFLMKYVSQIVMYVLKKK